LKILPARVRLDAKGEIVPVMDFAADDGAQRAAFWRGNAAGDFSFG